MNSGQAESRSPSHFPPARVAELLRAEVTRESESHFFAGLGGDVLRGGGVFIATYRNAKVGEAVRIDLIVDGRPVVTRGVVRWRTPGGTDVPAGIGISLADLSDDDRSIVGAFCARRPPLYFDLNEHL